MSQLESNLPVVSNLILALLVALIFVIVSHSNYTSLTVYLLLVVFTTLALTYDGQVVIRLKVTRIHLQIGLMLVSGGLLYAHLLNVELSGIWLAAFVIVMILLPGMSALELIGPNPTSSGWENLGLVYGLGFSYDCVAGILVLGVSASQRGTWLLSSTLALSILSVLIGVLRWKRKRRILPQRPMSAGYDDLLLVGILGVLVLIYIGLYPNLSAIVNDVYRGYLRAKLVSNGLNAGTTTGDGPLLYVFQALPFSVANPSEATFQIAYIPLNLFMVISFYAMAKAVLRGYPRQTPVIATAFWSLFSGFGWIEYLTQSFNSSPSTFISVIAKADVVSYGDIWTLRRNFYFLSMEASLAIVFLIIYLTLRTELGTKKFALLVPLATLIPFLHPYVIYFLFFFLVVLAFVLLERQRDDLRQAGFSFLIAALPSCAISYILGMHGLESSFGLYGIFALVGLAILLVCSPSLGHRVPRRVLSFSHIMKRGHAVLSITIVLMALYLGFLASWYAGAVSFNFQSLLIFGYVPWELYPVRLGIVGALGILGFFLAFKKTTGATRELVSLFILTVLMILALRATSEFQLLAAKQAQLFSPGSALYTLHQVLLGIEEDRFVYILMVPLSMIAAVTVMSLVPSRSKHTSSRVVLTLAIVSMLVVSGTSSLVLGFEYCQSACSPQLNPFQVEALQSVQSQALRQATSLITSPATDPSLLVLSESTVIATESPAIWASVSPEFPLSVLRYSSHAPTYIFLSNGPDTSAISAGSTYLDQLANLASTIVQNQGAQVRLVQNMSAPSSSSSTALVVPYDSSDASVTPRVNSTTPNSGLYAVYDFLSSAELNFTSVLPQDSHLTEYNTLVLPYDDINDSMMLESMLGQMNGTKTFVVLNDNGFGPILEAFGTLSSRSIIAGNVDSPGAMTALEQPVNVSVISPNDNVDVAAWYSNGNLLAPFIMSESYKDHTLVYVDILPIVQNEEIVGSGVSRLAGAALEPFIALSNPAAISPWFTSPSIIFSSMNSTGSIVMKSNSIIVAGLNETSGLVLESGGTRVTVGPASSLVATGYDQVEVSATEASISGGYGFYSFVTLSNSSLVFSGTNHVNVTAGGSHLSGQQVSVIIPKTVTLLIREPVVSINGLADFGGFYSLHPPSLYSDGRPVQLRGEISFRMYSSDTSSVALPVSFGAGTIASYKTALMSFDEWSEFLASVPFVAAVACVLILAWVFSHLEIHRKRG